MNTIDELYKLIPKLECKGLCGKDICEPIPVTVAERDRIIERAGLREYKEFRCPYLSSENKCTVYDIRPAICRLWGTVNDPRMKCSYGCKPEYYLSRAETLKLLAKISEVGGQGVMLAMIPVEGNELMIRVLESGAAVEDLIWFDCDKCKEPAVCVGFNSGKIVSKYCEKHAKT